MLMKGAVIVTIATVGSLFIISCAGPAANSTNLSNAGSNIPAVSSTPGPAAMAKELYQTNCAICHKETGKGGKVIVDGKELDPEDLTAEKIKKMTDEKLIGHITEGIEDEGMPAFKDKLSADEIKTVVAFVRALQFANSPKDAPVSNLPNNTATQ
jgi:mono/diheme cytochrome c family protein